MSHAEIINYGAIGLQCAAVCHQVDNELKQINDLIHQLQQDSTILQTKQMKEMSSYLIAQKQHYESVVQQYLARSEELKRHRLKQKNPVFDAEKNRLQADLNQLKKDMVEFSLGKIPMLREMISKELSDFATRSVKKYRDQADGILTVDAEILQQLSLIEDITVREAVYRSAIDQSNAGKSFDTLVELGHQFLENMKRAVQKDQHEETLLQIRKDMEKSRIDPHIIQQTLESSSDIRLVKDRAMDEMINEEIRLESVKIILKSIEDRGFLVDRKNNIKLDREKNEVKIVAQKANGQTAEFKVFLDGKFIYHFDGFEGQACQRDIQPFLSNLEDIYGIQITGRVDIWSNPDKLSSQKHQSMNTKKGNN